MHSQTLITADALKNRAISMNTNTLTHCATGITVNYDARPLTWPQNITKQIHTTYKHSVKPS